MEYIECTHCGKRYAVNAKIKDAEGEFVTCKRCQEKFMLVVRDSKSQGLDDDNFTATTGWNPTLTMPPTTAEDLNAVGGWDPSLTMPDSDTDDAAVDEEQLQADAEASLAAIQKEKKTKQLTYAVFGLVLVLLAFTAYMAWMGNEPQVQVAQQAPSASTQISVEQADKDNALCREAAAKQWLIDNKAMNSDYTAEQFVEILKQSQAQMMVVKSSCQNPLMLKNIISAVSAQEKPEWLALEIQALQ